MPIIANFAYRDLETRPWSHPISVKDIDFGTNGKRVYIFLLVINSNFSPILHRFGDMVA